MGKKTFKVDILSKSSVENLKKGLLAYKNDLHRKCQQLVVELANKGIEVAEFESGNFGKYISFTKQIETNTSGCKAIMLATNTGIIKSEWRTQDGVKSADVSPLLMAEFGSGLKAQNPLGVPGVGTGTFPGQSHATDPSGWWWMDLDGEWHHSAGMEPKAPMYKASIAMFEEVERIAKEVFA